jgi:hypothetical protein
MCEPWHLTTLWTSTPCYRDSFTLPMPCSIKHCDWDLPTCCWTGGFQLFHLTGQMVAEGSQMIILYVYWNNIIFDFMVMRRAYYLLDNSITSYLHCLFFAPYTFNLWGKDSKCTQAKPFDKVFLWFNCNNIHSQVTDSEHGESTWPINTSKFRMLHVFTS